jgi:hypothetical protein
MRNQTYYRRLKALEIENAERRRTWRWIFERSLPSSLEELTTLLCAFGHDQRRIPLTENESAAKKAYVESVKVQCGLVGLQDPRGAT